VTLCILDTRMTAQRDEHTIAVHIMRYVGTDAVGHHLTPTLGLCSLSGITFRITCAIHILFFSYNEFKMRKLNARMMQLHYVIHN